MGALSIARNMGMQHNVTIRVVDRATGITVGEHVGHNQATNSMLVGIGRYLLGDGVLNQGVAMLSNYVPKYISLGTMGLYSQESDALGLPAGIGVSSTDVYGNPIDEETRFSAYMQQRPGYGADGYDPNQNNGRSHLGLGPMFSGAATNCELISTTFPRSQISFRDVIPETESELPGTIDIVYSAMISTGALAQFRGTNSDGSKMGHVFITEVGLWSKQNWSDSSSNGLLAGYRIAPPNRINWDMSVAENRDILKHQIIRVGVNQIVQVIWKIQIGSVDKFV